MTLAISARCIRYVRDDDKWPRKCISIFLANLSFIASLPPLVASANKPAVNVNLL